ncbi:hypothetical protein KA107_01335 [Candidatus Pacearchaeota archaeon]|nr:hypothetical protein [Candidatus Pacearchaeota archaeon]
MGRGIQCIDHLLDDLKDIEKGAIAGGDYKRASSEWEFALMERHFYSLERDITQLHFGPSFFVASERLKVVLEKEQIDQIRPTLTMIKAYGAQTHLPVSED